MVFFILYYTGVYKTSMVSKSKHSKKIKNNDCIENKQHNINV